MFLYNLSYKDSNTEVIHPLSLYLLHLSFSYEEYFVCLYKSLHRHQHFLAIH